VFHTTLHRLRKTLEMDIVQSTNRRYYIAPDLDIVYDVREYLAAAKGAQATKDQALFDKAAHLYRGSYLAGFESIWCEDQRDALHATHLSLLTDASKVFERQSNIQQAAWYAHLAAQHEPYSDTVWTELARLFDLMGDARRAERARERSSNWDF
jgi:two-component SAPR family response regulator